MQAPQLINTILKPFEVLTRSFLWRSKPSTDTSAKPVEAAPPAAGEAPAGEDEAQAAPATSAAPRTEASTLPNILPLERSRMVCSHRDLQHQPISFRDAGGPAESLHMPLPVSSVRLAAISSLW